MRNFIREWLGLPPLVDPKKAEDLHAAAAALHPMAGLGPLTDRSQTEHIRIAVLPASNGKIIEVGKFKPNPRGPDWTFEHHLVTPDQSLVDAITKVMTINALDQN